LRLINIEQVTDDMCLAKPIYQRDGSNILLNTGCSNLTFYKDKLSDLGVHYIYVEDEYSAGIEINDVITDITRINSKRIVCDVLDSITKGRDINIQQVKNAVENMIEEILQNSNVLIGLSDVRTNDEYTFSHSVNVAVLALVLGNALGYDKSQLQKLGVGALLHDIGKAKIPNEILNKPGRLTREECRVIKEHSQLGFDAVKNDWELSPLSRTIILSHHEKLDGSGYPRAVKGDEIHEFAKIVAICDVFDALTADRCYSPKWPVYQAIEYLQAYAGTQFDEMLSEKFIEHIAAYPNGAFVKLSDLRRGIVFAQNLSKPTRPVIRILEENKKKLKADDCYLVDLMNEIDIVIAESE